LASHPRVAVFLRFSSTSGGGEKDEGKTFQINAPGAPRRQTWSASCSRRQLLAAPGG
jgi:hypothetical protein